MKLWISGLMATGLIAATACNQTPKDAAQQNNTQSNRTEMPSGRDETSGVFSSVYAHYQHLSMALASDDGAEAAEAAEGLLQALSQSDPAAFSPEEKVRYDALSEEVSVQAAQIAGSAGNIEKQREHLVPLSEHMYAMARELGTDKPLYKVYCPMYRKDQGAYWIQDSKEVKNPYFGAQMLSCGEVQETIQ